MLPAPSPYHSPAADSQKQKHFFYNEYAIFLNKSWVGSLNGMSACVFCQKIMKLSHKQFSYRAKYEMCNIWTKCGPEIDQVRSMVANGSMHDRWLSCGIGGRGSPCQIVGEWKTTNDNAFCTPSRIHKSEGKMCETKVLWKSIPKLINSCNRNLCALDAKLKNKMFKSAH